MVARVDSGMPRARSFLLCLLSLWLTATLSSHAATRPLSLGAVPQAQINTKLVRIPVVDGDDIQFSHLSADQGLSQTRVAQIVQDDLGFMWFGTQYGLNRYDGYEFKTYVHDPAREGSLSCAFVQSLFKDRSGTLWVGCDQFLDRFDQVTETFTHCRIESKASHGLPETVFDISQDHNNVLWLATGGGLYGLEPATGRLTHYGHNPQDSSSLSSDDVKSTGEDSHQRFWVADGQNLEEFDRKSGTVLLRVPLHGAPGPTSFARLGNQSFYEDHFGVFWILYTSGERGSGLAVLDRASNTLTHYSLYDEKSGAALEGAMMAAVEDQDNTLWFATMGGGLLRFDREHGIFIRYRNRLDDPNSLDEDRVISLFADREGTVWAGLHLKRPNFFQRKRKSFTPLLGHPNNSNRLPKETAVNALYEDHQGDLWISLSGALVRLNRKPGQYRVYRPPGPGLYNDVITITEDRSGVLWVGSTGTGLSRLDRATGQFKTYHHNPADPSSLSNDSVNRLLVDRTGKMWVATWNGLDLFDPANGRFIVYKQDKQSESEQYFSIAQDQTGSIWLGGSRGLSHFEPSTGQFTLYSHQPGDPKSLSDDTVNTVYIDHSGTIWAATESGLNKLDLSSGTFTTYYEKDGLSSNLLSCILEDQSGKLWISSPRGVSRFDPLTKTSKNYSVADGIPGADLSGWDSCFKSPGGEMFFGGYSGGIAFHPDQVVDRSYAPPIVLTDFQLFGNPVEIGPQSPLQRSITYANGLTLSHEENVFSFAFAGLSYFDQAGSRYRYKLDGLDRQWTEVSSGRRLANYTTLPAGRYTLRIQAATSQGSWGEPGVKLGITILPAWWDTWWFRAACVAAFLGVLWALHQLRLRQIRQAFNARLEERVGERTRIARDLHDTLLQSFQGLLLRFQTVSALFETRPANAKEILTNAIDQTAQAITEGREAVQGLRASTVERNDLARAIKTLGDELAVEASGNTAVGLQVDVEGTPRMLHPIVRDEIYRIASEALRNALRHAEAKQIEVELRYDERQFRLLVRDDGRGIDPNFLTAEGREGHFGLHGMRERAKLMGGKLTVWTAAESGTEIELIIPAAHAYASPPRRSWFAERFSGKSVRSKP
jgi:signal transduction histidine kinase/ligand-binding sensor domain-containing protein